MMKPNTPCTRWASLALLGLAALGGPELAAADYQSQVLSDQPLAYLRFNDAPKTDTVLNIGTAGTQANGTNLGLVSFPGALIGDHDASASFAGNGSRVLVPFRPELNPDATKSFTIEAWFYVGQEVSDSPGPCPLFNRVSSGNRQGWVFFQRSPASGWNFRTYFENGSSVGINLTGQSPKDGSGKAGTWSHVVVAYDGPTTTATMYVNGDNVGSATGPYVANTAANSPLLSIGAYDSGSNPFNGAVDEVALYPGALSAADVLAHYQNGTNAHRGASYDSVIAKASPALHLKLNEPTISSDVAVNFGTLAYNGKASGYGTNTGAATRSFASADGSSAATLYNGTGARTLVPFNPAFNPDAGQEFSVEAWFLVGQEVSDSPGPCPLFNRVSSGNRQGWVFFQRSPSSGWNFRTYFENGSSVGVNLTGQASNPNAGKAGTWNHVVVTWSPGDTTATMFVNGEKVASGSGPYVANTEANAPALSIGAYDSGSNPYYGAVSDVAIYTNQLTAERVLAHYKAGTNSNRAIAYSPAVLADAPSEYLPLSEPSLNPVRNLGSTGSNTDAQTINTGSRTAGPQSAKFPGFDASNSAASFDGTSSFIGLGNPLSLPLSQGVTLEAWVQPAATIGTNATIVSEGGPNADNPEIALRIVEGPAYSFIVYNNGTLHEVTAPIPAADLGGQTWIHLAGSYDGTSLVLTRNGETLAQTNSPAGPAAEIFSPWAIGAHGDGTRNFFAGTIDEVAIYGKALSATQLKAHFAAASGNGDTTPPTSTGTNWTIIVYGHADHNLSQSLITDMKEMEKVGSGPGFNIVVQADFDASAENAGLPAELKTGVTRFLMQKETDPNVITSTPVERLPELNMDDPQVLTDFIAWAIKKYPADRYGLVMWDHGGQWKGFGGDTQDGTTHGPGMNTATIRTAVSSAMSATGLKKWEFFAYDTCLMGGAECLPDVIGLTDVYIACPEIDYGPGWDYTGALGFLRANPSATPLEFGKAEAKSWEGQHMVPGSESDLELASHAVYDLTKYQAFAESFDAFGAEVRKLATAQDSTIPQVRLNTTQYSLGGVKDLGKPTDFIDVGEFAQKLAAANNAPASLKDAAAAMINNLDSMVVAKVLGQKKLTTHGLSVFYPMNYAEDQAAYSALASSIKPTASWPSLLAAVDQNRQADTSAPAIAENAVALLASASLNRTATTATASQSAPAKLGFKVTSGDDAFSAQAAVVTKSTKSNQTEYVYLGQIANQGIRGLGNYQVQWDGRLPMLSGKAGETPVILGGFYDDTDSDIVVSYAYYTPPREPDGFNIALITRITNNTPILMSAVDVSSDSLAPEDVVLKAGGTLEPWYYSEIRNGTDPNKWISDYVSSPTHITIPDTGFKGLKVAYQTLPAADYHVEVQVLDYYQNQSGVLEFAVSVGSTSGGPALTITSSQTGKITLSWTATAGLALQSTTAVGSVAWTDATDAGTATANGVNTLTVNAAGSARFFRLIAR